MIVNYLSDEIVLSSGLKRISDVVTQISSLSASQLASFFIDRKIKLPRHFRMNALRTVLNPKIARSQEMTLTDEQRFRLLRYPQFSEIQLENFFLVFSDEDSFSEYKEALANLIILGHQQLKLEDEELTYLLDLEPLNPEPNFVEYQKNLLPGVLDNPKHFEGLPYDTFRVVLNESSTLNELREVGVKHDMNIPRRLKKNELVKVIISELKDMGVYKKEHDDQLAKMSVVVLQRFAKDNGIKASVELKKEELIEFILKAAIKSKSFTNSRVVGQVMTDDLKNFEFLPEMVRNNKMLRLDNELSYDEVDNETSVLDDSDVVDNETSVLDDGEVSEVVEETTEEVDNETSVLDDSDVVDNETSVLDDGEVSEVVEETTEEVDNETSVLDDEDENFWDEEDEEDPFDTDDEESEVVEETTEEVDNETSVLDDEEEPEVVEEITEEVDNETSVLDDEEEPEVVEEITEEVDNETSVLDDEEEPEVVEEITEEVDNETSVLDDDEEENFWDEEEDEEDPFDSDDEESEVVEETTEENVEPEIVEETIEETVEPEVVEETTEEENFWDEEDEEDPFDTDDEESEVVEEPTEETLEPEMVEETTEETIEPEVVEETTEEIVEPEVVEETIEEIVELEVVEETTEETVEPEVVEEPTEEIVEPEVVEETTEEIVEPEVVEETTEETVEPEVVEEPTEEIVEPEVVEETTEETVESEVVEEIDDEDDVEIDDDDILFVQPEEDYSNNDTDLISPSLLNYEEEDEIEELFEEIEADKSDIDTIINTHYDEDLANAIAIASIQEETEEELVVVRNQDVDETTNREFFEQFFTPTFYNAATTGLPKSKSKALANRQANIIKNEEKEIQRINRIQFAKEQEKAYFEQTAQKRAKVEAKHYENINKARKRRKIFFFIKLFIFIAILAVLFPIVTGTLGVVLENDAINNINEKLNEFVPFLVKVGTDLGEMINGMLKKE